MDLSQIVLVKDNSVLVGADFSFFSTWSEVPALWFRTPEKTSPRRGLTFCGDSVVCQDQCPGVTAFIKLWINSCRLLPSASSRTHGCCFFVSELLHQSAWLEFDLGCSEFRQWSIPPCLTRCGAFSALSRFLHVGHNFVVFHQHPL